ncbi:MAG TPA: DUF3817 domain-containing protein [Noviherbaspirillum sp.]|jgi:integral membrane protein|uniref:DUF3817 domain-containing protein n=1 Tax=Noviherbaspirillum sp. TaxID=1926288 RepID=UPI002F929D0F
MIKNLSSVRGLRLLAALEATTLVVLVFIAVPLKYLSHDDALVSVMGPVHGMTFLLYAWLVISSAAAGALRTSEAWTLMAAALVPFGGFLTLRRLGRRGAPS